MKGGKKFNAKQAMRSVKKQGRVTKSKLKWMRRERALRKGNHA